MEWNSDYNYSTKFIWFRDPKKWQIEWKTSKIIQEINIFRFSQMVQNLNQGKQKLHSPFTSLPLNWNIFINQRDILN